MTTTRVYKSTDSDAPVLTGETGSLQALLKAVLYGDGSGVAYGSGATEKAAAGWSVEFESGNKIVLRNSVAAGGSGCHARIDDGASGAGGAREALVRVYKTMSDIDSGDDPAPSTSQLSAGAVLRKSSTANSTAREWIVLADELTAYIFTHPDESSTYDQTFNVLGDFESIIPGDGYNYCCGAKSSQNSASGSLQWLTRASSTASASNGLCIGRSYTGAYGAVYGAILSYGLNSGGLGTSSDIQDDPAPGSGKRFVIPAMVVEGGTIRGRMRGLYVPLNRINGGISAGTIVTFDDLPGALEELMALTGQQTSTNTTNTATVFIDHTGPW